MVSNGGKALLVPDAIEGAAGEDDPLGELLGLQRWLLLVTDRAQKVTVSPAQSKCSDVGGGEMVVTDSVPVCGAHGAQLVLEPGLPGLLPQPGHVSFLEYFGVNVGFGMPC